MAKSEHKEKPLISVAIILVAIILALSLGQITTMKSLEYGLLDYRFKLRGSLDVSDSPIVILAIDDQSDESTPHRWPWPREYYAHVIENLNEAGAKVIGIDIIMEQADIHGPQSDDKLTQTLKKYSNVVLAGKIMKHEGQSDYIYRVEPYENFLKHGTPWGLVSFDLDEDGVYRKYTVAQLVQDSIFSSFAIELLRLYRESSRSISIQNFDEYFVLGSDTIPKYGLSHSALINYAGPSATFKRYSFDSILDDEDFDLLEDFDLDSFSDPGDPEFDIPPGLLYSGDLKDKIVLIGATMQELHDDFSTPFLETKDSEGRIAKILTNGVEIHANALNMILTKNYLSEISSWGLFGVLILLAVIVYILTRFLPTYWGAGATFLLISVYFIISFVLFTNINFIIEISTPTLLILFTFMGNNLYHYVLSQHEKKMIQGAFMHYVPEKVVSEILADPEKLTLGGEERIVTVLFSDVAGFTSISEKLSPAELVNLLNDYLTEMTDIVLENKGIIDKYEGDAIMAEFGVPVSYDDHAYMACNTALEMQKKLKSLRDKWKEEGRPQLRARIGINTGEVIVGNMGSRNVFDYTVMGDHVNLGSRLEGANKFYGTYIMISEFTHEIIKNDFYTRELDLIRVKGKEQPIKVFELIALKKDPVDDKFLELLESYKKGISYYKTQEWNEAIDCFEYCIKIFPNDKPSEEYRSRCIEYKFNGPGPDWDGVTVMKEK